MHTRFQKKRVRRKKEAGKEGDKKSKVPPYTTPPPDRPPPAENMFGGVGGQRPPPRPFFNEFIMISRRPGRPAEKKRCLIVSPAIKLVQRGLSFLMMIDPITGR